MYAHEALHCQSEESFFMNLKFSPLEISPLPETKKSALKIWTAIEAMIISTKVRRCIP